MVTIHDKLLLSNKVMALNPYRDSYMDPMIHRGYYSMMFQLRQELHSLGQHQRKRRKVALKMLYENDVKEEDANLRLIGRAYMLSYP